MIEQQLTELRRIMPKHELKAIESKMSAYLSGIIKNKRLDAFPNNMKPYYDKMQEIIKELDAYFLKYLDDKYIDTGKKQYFNFIEELKSNIKREKSEDQKKWEDLIAYVDARSKKNN